MCLVLGICQVLRMKDAASLRIAGTEKEIVPSNHDVCENAITAASNNPNTVAKGSNGFLQGKLP